MVLFFIVFTLAFPLAMIEIYHIDNEILIRLAQRLVTIINGFLGLAEIARCDWLEY